MSTPTSPETGGVTGTPVLVSQLPEVQNGFKWPEPITDHLSLLVKTVRQEAGQQTTRKELTAAIIAFTAPDSAQLSELLEKYRQLTTDELS